jgi:hypothetical protein
MKDVTPDGVSLTEHPSGYYFPSAFEGNRIKLVRDQNDKMAKRSRGGKLKRRFLQTRCHLDTSRNARGVPCVLSAYVSVMLVRSLLLGLLRAVFIIIIIVICQSSKRFLISPVHKTDTIQQIGLYYTEVNRQLKQNCLFSSKSLCFGKLGHLQVTYTMDEILGSKF